MLPYPILALPFSIFDERANCIARKTVESGTRHSDNRLRKTYRAPTCFSQLKSPVASQRQDRAMNQRPISIVIPTRHEAAPIGPFLSRSWALVRSVVHSGPSQKPLSCGKYTLNRHVTRRDRGYGAWWLYNLSALGTLGGGNRNYEPAGLERRRNVVTRFREWHRRGQCLNYVVLDMMAFSGVRWLALHPRMHFPRWPGLPKAGEPPLDKPSCHRHWGHGASLTA